MRRGSRDRASPVSFPPAKPDVTPLPTLHCCLAKGQDFGGPLSSMPAVRRATLEPSEDVGGVSRARATGGTVGDEAAEEGVA